MVCVTSEDAINILDFNENSKDALSILVTNNEFKDYG
jgi:hypothetical protein